MTVAMYDNKFKVDMKVDFRFSWNLEKAVVQLPNTGSVKRQSQEEKGERTEQKFVHNLMLIRSKCEAISKCRIQNIRYVPTYECQQNSVSTQMISKTK